MQDDLPAPSRSAHPILFLILYLPFGMSSGFLAVTLEYLLRQSGITTLVISGLIALGLFPQTFKVLWAPLVDATLSAKRWYLMAVTVAALTTAATGLLPMNAASLPILSALILGQSVAVSFLAMGAERLMALATAPDKRGRAGGWSQAGNVGGAGLGGGAGLWMAIHIHPLWISCAVLGAVYAACSIALLFIREPATSNDTPLRGRGPIASVIEVARECWDVCRSWTGLLTIVIFVLPIGTGAASNLFSAISKEWSASADLISDLAWVSGIVTAVGAVFGGWLCDRMNRRTAYAVFGLVQAAAALAMAFGPRTPTAFVIFAFAYAATVGLTFASFSALTLETIGSGAAATKYNLFACISNVPIFYMAPLEGWADTRWNGGAMLNLEAAMATGGVAIFALLAFALRRRVTLALAT